MIIYTSGTTGKPKGALHSHAGFPIKAAHDLAYCFDLHDDDRLFWFTDLGWMMGPWLISGGLMLGASIVIFEGTPDFPNPDRVWEIIERHKVTVFGVAPTAIRALMSKGDRLGALHDLSSLRVLGSTGETWNPDPGAGTSRESAVAAVRSSIIRAERRPAAASSAAIDDQADSNPARFPALFRAWRPTSLMSRASRFAAQSAS